MATRTVYYDHEDIGDEEAFRRNVRMECHLAGYEVVDFDLVGQHGRPYVTYSKKQERKLSQPKARFFL